MKRLWITGYRSYELNIFKDDDPKAKVIKQVLKSELIQAIEDGTDWIITGGQMGVEQWSVQVANELKSDYPDEFKIGVMLPFQDFGNNWNQNNQFRLSQTIKLADYSASVSNIPYQSPKQLRNYQKFMLMHTDEAILIYDNDNPGKSKYDYQSITNFSNRQNYPYHLVDFADLQEAAIEYQENKQNDLQN